MCVCSKILSSSLADSGLCAANLLLSLLLHHNNKGLSRDRALSLSLSLFSRLLYFSSSVCCCTSSSTHTQKRFGQTQKFYTCNRPKTTSCCCVWAARCPYSTCCLNAQFGYAQTIVRVESTAHTASSALPVLCWSVFIILWATACIRNK